MASDTTTEAGKKGNQVNTPSPPSAAAQPLRVWVLPWMISATMDAWANIRIHELPFRQYCRKMPTMTGEGLSIAVVA
jgi:hypothetical protein